MGAGFLVFLFFFWGGGMLSLREIGKPALVSRDFKLLSDHGDKNVLNPSGSNHGMGG